jgi:L-threonylcarbamoyladenylate synthase
MGPVAALRAGGLVVLPTDTVYGLCALPEHAGRLADVKQRPSMPVALLCADVATLLELVPEAAGRVESLLPGPYTLVLPNPAGRFPELGGGESVGVRVPELPAVSAEVVRQVAAVAATSANLHGGPNPRSLGDVPASIRAACAAEIDGGELPGVPSTVIDLTGGEPHILREGAGASE